MQDPQVLPVLVASGGFALAAVFGWIAERTRFCTMGAVSDVVNMGDWSRMRMWLLAIAVAMLCANAMMAAGLIDLSKSLYTGPRLVWLSHIVGGALFGVGMTIASGCGVRSLVRLGGGNLKSLVVLLCLGLVASMTMRGILAPFRVNVLDRYALQLAIDQSLPSLLMPVGGRASASARLLVAAVVSGALGWFALRDPAFRRQRVSVLGGVGIGLLVAGGWYVTGHLGYLPEDPETLEEAFLGTNTRRPESFSFVGPVAYALELLLLWTDASLKVTFGIAAVVGVLVGAWFHAVTTGQFRWQSFASPGDLGNHMVGGALMGFGGVCALGCTIGQGITGMSTLALGSFLTLLSVIAGSALTMKWLYWRFERAGA